MPPKKQKEQTFSLDQFTEKFAGSSNWAEEEADFNPFSNATPSSIASIGAAPAAGGWGAGSAGFGAGSSSFEQPQLPVPDVPPFSARIGNIAYECTEADLESFFGAHPIESVRLPRDQSGRIRGSAFIDFQTKEGLVAALALSGTQMMGRAINVSVAEQRPSGFGKPSFDWGARSQQQPSFTPRPQTSRFDAGPSDWSQRSAPQGHRDQPPREFREPPAPKDWSQRSQQQQPQFQAHPPRERERRPQPSLNWGDRSQVERPERRAPKERSIREHSNIPTSLDWSARSQRGGPSAGPGAGASNLFKKPAPKPEEPKNNTPKVSNPYDLLRDE